MFRKLKALTQKMIITGVGLTLSTAMLASSASGAKLTGRIQTTDAEEVLHTSILSTDERPLSDDSGSPVLMAWRASGDPQAVLVVLHGFGLHKEAFEAFAERMIKQNITVFGLDARGFGCWNQTGKTSKLDFAASLNDVDNLVQHIHRQHPGKPVFVLGESMGGATALAYAAAHRHTINGVVLSVPAYKRVAAARTTIEVAANFLWHRGRRVQLEQVMVNRASHDQALKGTWENDPKARLSVSLTDLIHFSSFMKQCRQNASLIDDLPVLFVQGEADKLIKPSGTEELFKRMPNRRSSWH